MMEHQHYVGAAHSFEIVKTNDRPDVTVLKTFFIDDTVNANDWQTTWEGMKLDAEELPGTPLVLQEDLEHPKFSVQEYYDRGTIFDYDIDEENHKIIVYVRITDLTVVERIKSGELQFVSPAVIPKGSESLRKVNGVDVLDRSLPLHLAIVGNPAYGKEKAKMTHLCSGDGQECYHRLKTMTANVEKIIKREHELIDQGIPEEEVHKILKKEFAQKKAEGDGGDGGNSGIKSNLKIKNAEGIPALEQIPFIKKMVAKTSRIASTMDKTINERDYFIHNGHRGQWINAKGMDVFVAQNQSIKKALLEQCGCAKF
jgi:hypothetical protein